MRARPVPFCRQSLRPAPLTSLFSLVLCVPRRSPARYHREASCKRCLFTSAPKTVSASSTWPTFLPSKLTTSTTGMICSLSSFQKIRELLLFLCRFLGLVNENVRSTWPRHRTANQQQVLIGVHLDHFQILRRHLDVTEVSGKVLVLPDAGRERTAADAAWCAMEHRTVSRVPACIVPALHAACEAATLADAGDVNQLAGLEVLDQHAVANLGFILRFGDAHFLQNLDRSHVRLLEVACHRLVYALRLHEFDQAQLRSVVAVLFLGAALNYNARACLKHSATDEVAVFSEHLRHAQFDSDNSIDCHCLVSLLAACRVGIGCSNLIFCLVGLEPGTAKLLSAPEGSFVLRLTIL